jgi:hypothetical protein
MRKIHDDDIETEGAPLPLEDCPWCRGTGFVSVPDYRMIERLGTIDTLIAVGELPSVPRMSVRCPSCYPNGLRIGKMRHLNLRQHADRVHETMPYEYWLLMCTVAYVLLYDDHGDEALTMLASSNGIEGFAARHILEPFQKKKRVTQSVREMVKRTTQRLTKEQQYARWERQRYELDRMLGERDMEE